MADDVAGMTFVYDAEQAHDMDTELPTTAFLIQLDPAARSSVERDEWGDWIPQVGDPIITTQVHLERVESSGDVPHYLIGG